jgi:MFS family permease
MPGWLTDACPALDADVTAGRRRPLTALLAANVISITGDAATLMGVPWFVLTSTGSAADAGIVACCALLPVALSSLTAGPVVDRMGRRPVSIASDLVCVAAVGAIPLLQSAGLLRFWMLCALMAIAGLFHAPGETARGSMLPELARAAGVPLSRAAGFYDGAARCAGMIGSAVGGVLIAALGADHVLIVDAASFALSAALVAVGLRGGHGGHGGPGGHAGLESGPRPAPGTTGLPAYRRALGQGARYVLASPLLLGICLVTMLAQGLDQGWSAVLLPVHVHDDLGGAPALGLVEALFSAGALAGALIYGVAGGRVRRWPLFVVAFAVVGAPRFAVAALTGTVTPLAVMMTVEGLACGVINPILATAVYETVPDELRSRVLGATTASALVIAPVGGLAAGLLVGSTGLVTALLATGGAYLLVTLCPLVFPSWRQLDNPGGAPDAFGQLGGEPADLREPGGRVGCVEERLDQDRLDDHTVGEARHVGGLIGGGDADADADGKLGDRPDASRQGGRGLVDRGAGAGDAHQRGGVDEPRAGRGDLRQPFAGAARRDHEDRREAAGGGGPAPWPGLLHGQVGQDAARSPGLGQLAGETVDAVADDRIPVRHHQHRLAGGPVGLAHRADHVADPDAAAQGDVVGGLDDRAVQHRIGMREADLDDVGAVVEDRPDRGDAAVDGREAGRQPGDERSPVLSLRPGEGVGQQLDVPAHDETSSAAVPASAPRPK